MTSEEFKVADANRIHSEAIIFDATCPLATVGCWCESWLMTEPTSPKALRAFFEAEEGGS